MHHYYGADEKYDERTALFEEVKGDRTLVNAEQKHSHRKSSHASEYTEARDDVP